MVYLIHSAQSRQSILFKGSYKTKLAGVGDSRSAPLLCSNGTSLLAKNICRGIAMQSQTHTVTCYLLEPTIDLYPHAQEVAR